MLPNDILPNDMLPNDMLQVIADFADIDSRRYMGFPPRKIPTDVLSRMNGMMERKHLTKYHGYDGQITAFLATSSVDDGIMSAMYVRYHYDIDELQVLHTTGVFRCPCLNAVAFDTANIVRSVDYHTSDAFGENPLCTSYENAGLLCRVSPFNYSSIRNHLQRDDATCRQGPPSVDTAGLAARSSQRGPTSP